MQDKLTFDNLYQLLEKFSSTSDVNREFAETIVAKITNGTKHYRVVHNQEVVSDVVDKTLTRRRSRIPCVVVEKITTRRREGVGVVIEKNESRRTFNKNSCDLLTAITHTKF